MIPVFKKKIIDTPNYPLCSQLRGYGQGNDNRWRHLESRDTVLTCLEDENRTCWCARFTTDGSKRGLCKETLKGGATNIYSLIFFRWMALIIAILFLTRNPRPKRTKPKLLCKTWEVYTQKEVTNMIQWNLPNWTPLYTEHLRTLNTLAFPVTMMSKGIGPLHIKPLHTLNSFGFPMRVQRTQVSLYHIFILSQERSPMDCVKAERYIHSEM